MHSLFLAAALAGVPCLPVLAGPAAPGQAASSRGGRASYAVHVRPELMENLRGHPQEAARFYAAYSGVSPKTLEAIAPDMLVLIEYFLPQIIEQAFQDDGPGDDLDSVRSGMRRLWLMNNELNFLFTRESQILIAQAHDKAKAKYMARLRQGIAETARNLAGPEKKDSAPVVSAEGAAEPATTLASPAAPVSASDMPGSYELRLSNGYGDAYGARFTLRDDHALEFKGGPSDPGVIDGPFYEAAGTWRLMGGKLHLKMAGAATGPGYDGETEVHSLTVDLSGVTKARWRSEAFTAPVMSTFLGRSEVQISRGAPAPATPAAPTPPVPETPMHKIVVAGSALIGLLSLAGVVGLAFIHPLTSAQLWALHWLGLTLGISVILFAAGAHAWRVQTRRENR